MLAVLMCVLPLAGNVTAIEVPETAQAVYTFSSVANYPGETVEVEISIESTAAGNTYALGNFTYDKDALEFLGFSNYETAITDLMFFPMQPDSGKMAISLPLKSKVSLSGKLCTMSFKIKSDAKIGSYTVSATSVVAKDGSTELESFLVPATITVKGQDFTGLSFNDKTVTYDSEVHNVEVTGVPDFATVEYKVDGRAFTGAEDAGTYEVTATVTAPGYNTWEETATLTINPAQITVNAVVNDKVYDGTDAVISLKDTPTFTGFIEGDVLGIDPDSLASVKFAKKDVGTHAIEHELKVIGPDKDNYEYTINVPKASITKRPASITADNKTVKLGEALPELTVVIDGVVDGETLDYTVTTTATNTNTVKNYPITVKADARKNPNYNITLTNGVLSVIDKTAQEVTVADVDDVTYGDDGFALEVSVGETATSSAVTYVSETPNVVTVDAQGNVTIVGAGTAKVTVSKAGDADYADFEETVTFTVNKKALAITADNQTVRVGGEMPKLTYKVEGLVDGDTLSGELKTAATSTNTVKNYPITQGTLKASANYEVTFTPGTLSVIPKKVQGISVDPVENKTYGDKAFSLVIFIDPAAGMAKTNIEYDSLTPAVVSVDEDGLVTILGAGTAKITVSKAGDADYADFSETVTFTVNKKALTITADNKTATKGGALPELTYKVEGLVDGDVLTGALKTTATSTNTVKDYPITQGTLKASANYDVTFIPGVLSVVDKLLQDITVTSNAPSDITYGDAGFKIDVAYGNTVTDEETVFASTNEEVVTVDAQGNVTVVGAGEATITVSKAGNDTIADFVEEIEVVVAKKPLTITAKDASKKVGAADPVLEYELDRSQLVGSDAISGNVEREEGEEVGTYIIGPGTLSITNSKNYDVNFIGGTFTIFDKTPQDIEVATVEGKTYGDAPFTIEVTYGQANVSSNETTFNSDNENVATVDAQGNVTIIGAGTAKITVAKAGDADLADFTKTVTVTVAKKAIKVTADAKEKYVDQATPELTYTVEGELVAGDAFTGELTVADGNKAGRSYDIKIGTLALNDNYKVTFVGAKLKVLSKLDQDITLGELEGVTYGDTGVVLEVTKGEYNTDADVVFASDDEEVVAIDADGNITIVGAGEAEISVTVAGNYKYNDFADSVTLTVAKKAVTVTADNKTKKFGTSDPELTYTPDVELVAGDEFTGALEREAGEELGTYDILKGTLALSDNYKLTFVKGTLTIVDKDPQNVTVTGIPDSAVYGDAGFAITAESTEIPGTAVEYTSSNEEVITIDDEGNASIVGAGEAVIEVKFAGNDDYAEEAFTKTVAVAAKEIAVTELDLVNKTVVFDAVVAADVLSVDFTKLTIAPEDVDEGQTPANYVVTGFELTGDASANYVLTTESFLVPISDEIALITVTVVSENGTVEGAGSYLEGAAVTLKAAANSGYKFDGWFVGEEKVSSGAEYTFTPDADVELIAKFSKKSGGGGGGTATRMVYFVVDETTTNKVLVDKGNKVAKPEDPTREGFKFEGWFTNSDYTEAYDFDAAVETSFNLYAKWTKLEEEKPDDKDPDEGEDTKPETWKNPYVDVDENDWFYEAVKTATEKGIMNGVSENEFAPSMNVTRAMLVTMLYRAEGTPNVVNDASDVKFEDIKADSYYADAVVWAYENGIVNGVAETKFAPDVNITREQIATIIFRYAAFKGVEAVNLSENLHFDDADEISEYAVAPMNWLVGMGIINGYTDGTVRPADNATRAEVATMAARIFSLLA